MAPVTRQIRKRNAAGEVSTSSSISLLDLPPEVLEIIIKKISYSEMQSRLRLVCKRLYEQCRSVTQTKFLKTEKEIKLQLMNMHDRLATKQITEKMHVIILYVLESLDFLYRMLRAVTWRYTYRAQKPKYFYGGLILEMVDYFLCVTRSVYSPSPKELFKCLSRIHVLCTEFCTHFERTVESKININCKVAGAKLTDILDCIDIENVHVLENNSGLNRTKFMAKYLFPLGFPFGYLIGGTSRLVRNWAEEQSLMYLHMRRLVFEHSLQLILNKFLLRMKVSEFQLPTWFHVYIEDLSVACSEMSQISFLNLGKLPSYNERQHRPLRLVQVTVALSSPMALAPYRLQERWSDIVVPDSQVAANGWFSQQVILDCDSSHAINSSFQWSVTSSNTVAGRKRKTKF